MHEIFYKNNNAIDELRKIGVILALTGDINDSEHCIDIINKIYCISAYSLMAKMSERELIIDAIPRQFNIYEIDFRTGLLNWTTYIKTKNWNELQKEPIKTLNIKEAKPEINESSSIIEINKMNGDIVIGDKVYGDKIVNMEEPKKRK